MIRTSCFYGEKSPIVGVYDNIDENSGTASIITVLNINGQLKFISSSPVTRSMREKIISLIKN